MVIHAARHAQGSECSIHPPPRTILHLRFNLHHSRLGLRRYSGEIFQPQIFFLSSRFSAVISAITARIRSISALCRASASSLRGVPCASRFRATAEPPWPTARQR
jgi:hypothetical protein